MAKSLKSGVAQRVINRKNALDIVEKLGVIAPRWDDVEDYLNVPENIERLEGEQRIHRKYNEKKKHVRRKNDKALEVIENLLQHDLHSGENHIDVVAAHAKKLKNLTK